MKQRKVKIKTKYIILNWWYHQDFGEGNIIVNEDGTNKVFNSKKKAEDYASNNLNGYWKIIGNEKGKK